MNVVWVDDDGDFRSLVSTLCARWTEHCIRVTDDVKDAALDTADLWVVDLSMAAMDGLSLAEEGAARGTPVVVVTSLATPHLVRHARAAGATAVWEKSTLLQLWPSGPAGLLGAA